MSLPAAEAPQFPPLWRPESVGRRGSAFDKALSEVLIEPVPGRLVYAEHEAILDAAVVLAPEMPLREAIGAVFAVTLGLADAIGALAPPEVAVHTVWPDRLAVNGAVAAGVRAAASTRDPAEEPDWLVVGITVAMQSGSDRPGLTAERTALHDEGCVEITAATLTETWSRHMLTRINAYLTDGFAPLKRDWSARCRTLGERVAVPGRGEGTFLGLDPIGGMLLRRSDTTETIPLTAILDDEWPNWRA